MFYVCVSSSLGDHLVFPYTGTVGRSQRSVTVDMKEGEEHLKFQSWIDTAEDQDSVKSEIQKMHYGVPQTVLDSHRNSANAEVRERIAKIEDPNSVFDAALFVVRARA